MREIIERRKLTPPQIASQLGVAPEKVLTWIASGELRAINLATRPNNRPRWYVDIDDLADFERRRSAVAPAKPSRRRNQPVSAKRYV